MVKANEQVIRRIEELVRRVEHFSDPRERDTAQQLMEAILTLHGSALERMLELTFTGEPGSSPEKGGEAMIRRFAGDDLVASLLVLHGLHPDDLETRTRHAIGKMQGHIELVGVFDGRVRVRADGQSAESVQAALRDALPDAEEILVEAIPPRSGFVPLAALETLAPRSQ